MCTQREPKGCLYSDTLHTRPHIKTRRDISPRRTTGDTVFRVSLYSFTRLRFPFYFYFFEVVRMIRYERQDFASLRRLPGENETKKKREKNKDKSLKGLFAVYTNDRARKDAMFVIEDTCVWSGDERYAWYYYVHERHTASQWHAAFCGI